MSNLQQVSDSDFEKEVLKADKPVFVKAEANWCQPCKRQGVILEKIAKEKEEYKVVFIDVEDSPKFSQAYNIRSLPTTLLLINGEEYGRFIGLGTEREILELDNRCKNEE
jgi:thioredoxin 1